MKQLKELKNKVIDTDYSWYLHAKEQFEFYTGNDELKKAELAKLIRLYEKKHAIG